MSLKLKISELLNDIVDNGIPDHLLERVNHVLSDLSAPPVQELSSREGCETLQQTVAELKSMQAPDVDAIIPLVEKGMAAYKACEGRINRVDLYLESLEKTAE